MKMRKYKKISDNKMRHFLKSLESMAKNAGKKKNEFVNWILSCIPDVPEPIKEPVNETLEVLEQQVSDIYKKWDSQSFKIRESDSALKGFAKRYVIDGHQGIDPQSFLAAVKTQVTNLLSRSHQTKVNLILTCTMEKRDIKTGEVIKTNAPSEILLDATDTDVNELYKNAVDKMMESMAYFQRMGGNWQFRSVVNLDINTAVYKPLRGNSYIPLSKELASKSAIINLKKQ